MEKTSFFQRFKNKKYLFFLFCFISALLLFTMQTKLVLDINVNGSAEAELYYTVPVYNSFEKRSITHLNFNEKHSVIEIPFNKRLVDEIKIKIYNYSNDFSFTINKAYIKPPLFPKSKIYLSGYEGSIIKVNDVYNNKGIFTFTKISPHILLISFLLLITIIVSVLYILQNEIIYIIQMINKPLKENIIFAGIIIFILLFEIFKITGMYRSYNGSDIPILLYILKEDSYFISIYILLFYAAAKTKSRYLSISILFFIILSVGVLMLDIGLINLFSIRFRIGEGAGFMLDASIIIKIALSFFITKAGVYSLILFIYTCLFAVFIMKNKNIYSFSVKETAALIITALISAPLFLIDINEVKNESTVLQESIVDANLSNTEKVPYSSEKINNLLNNFSLDYKCSKGLNTRKNIVIIIMESVSSYKSQLFSNMDDKIPFIDSLGKNNIYVKNYYCSNYNSNQNIFSIFTGYPLITSVKNDRRNILKYYNHSFIKEFQAQGYNVELYSAVDNDFDGISKIAYNSGIRKMYDANDPLFSHIKKRYLFNGIEDRELYKVVYEKIKNQNSPFLTIITTMSTHGPYIDPETKELSYDKTLEYADKSVKYFTEQLKQAGFFNNGILIITADHRAMLPVTIEEINNLGPFAHSAIPLVAAGINIPNNITGLYSHTDLGKSLEYLALDKVCFHKFQRNIFKDDNKDKSNCIIHQQGVDFTIVDVRCGDTYGQVQLKGDDTMFIKDNMNISMEKKQEILDYINYLRIID